MFFRIRFSPEPSWLFVAHHCSFPLLQKKQSPLSGHSGLAIDETGRFDNCLFAGQSPLDTQAALPAIFGRKAVIRSARHSLDAKTE
jgi:hypothetical protein